MITALSVTSQAGILNGHGAAYGGVTGSVPFNNGVGLSGTIDYAVFTANAFNANFAGLGYVPGDALVYTYQVNVAGNLGVSAEISRCRQPSQHHWYLQHWQSGRLVGFLYPECSLAFLP